MSSIKKKLINALASIFAMTSTNATDASSITLIPGRPLEPHFPAKTANQIVKLKDNLSADSHISNNVK